MGRVWKSADDSVECVLSLLQGFAVGTQSVRLSHWLDLSLSL